MTGKKKMIPLGFESFKRIIDDGFYYIDKTLFIKELIDYPALVNLITRPRRFGKTLNLSMLRYFFEKSEEDNSHLFSGLKIMDACEKYTSLMGQFPVIYLTLKGTAGKDFQEAIQHISKIISAEFARHSYVLQSGKLSEYSKKGYIKFINEDVNPGSISDSMRFLTKCLHEYYDKKVIVLIDEYDTPLAKAYKAGYYSELNAFINSMFNSALKTNEYLEFAVITGCLRISNESMISGLNNLSINNINSNSFSKFFGFTTEEVNDLLNYYEVDFRKDEIKDWYGGYTFGNNTEIYNPWSILYELRELCSYPHGFIQPYWSNFGSNSALRTLIRQSDNATKNDIEKLITGGTIKKHIVDNLSYDEVFKTQANIWSFLYFSGYLNKVSERREYLISYFTLKIPNREVHSVYYYLILDWFYDIMKSIDADNFYEPLLSENEIDFEISLNRLLITCLSWNDYNKSYYYKVLNGIFRSNSQYRVISTMDPGTDKPDFLLYNAVDRKKPAIVIKINYAETRLQQKSKVQEGADQIKNNHYEALLEANGHENVVQYAIAFYRNNCRVKLVK